MEVLGIQIDKPHLRVALIQKTRKRIEICTLKSALIAEPDNVKQLYKEHFKARISTGLSSNQVLIRSLALKISGHRRVEEAIAFQSEATSHLDPKEVLTVPLIKKKKEGSTEALLFTTSRDALKSHLAELEQLEIDPDQVSSNCTALCRYLHWKFPSLTDAFIIDLGSSEWSCAWMEEGQLKKSHSISGGIEALLSALWEDRKKILLQREIEGVAKQIDLLQLKSHLNPHLSQKINELRQELAKIIFSFHREAGFKPVFFTGRTDSFGHLRDYLAESFKEAICADCKGSLTPDEEKYAICLGLALDSGTLQFRREEFFPRKNWRRLGSYALLLIALSISLSIILCVLSTQILHSRKFQMLESLQSSLDRWDPSLKKTLFRNVENEEIILNRWIQVVENNNKEYPFIQQAPKVAEVLSWLSSHPLIEALRNEGDPLIVRELRYQLVEYPKIGTLQEPYLAKVELEFQVAGPMHARKFHEALLKGDDRVNPNLEITWETLSDSYRTSFYLKNRSPNVS